MVAAVRDAVGDRLELIVDLNQWWRMPGDIERGLGPVDARRAIERLREHGVLWVEEPLDGDDRTGCGRCARGTGVRIAGGEMARTFEELRLALDADALDVYQPDVVLSLGISGARTFAELALRRNRWFTPHTWTNGIGVLANLHVCAGVGGGPLTRVPVRPARVDARSGATSCSPSRWGSTPDGMRRRSRRARARDRARRGVDRVSRGRRRRGPHEPRSARRRSSGSATWAGRCAAPRPGRPRGAGVRPRRRSRWPARSMAGAAPPRPRPIARGAEALITMLPAPPQVERCCSATAARSRLLRARLDRDRA